MTRKKFVPKNEHIVRSNMFGQKYDCKLLLDELDKLSFMLSGSYIDARPDDFWLKEMISAVKSSIRYEKPSWCNTTLPPCYVYTATDYGTTCLKSEELVVYLEKQKSCINRDLKYLYGHRPELKKVVTESCGKKKHWWMVK